MQKAVWFCLCDKKSQTDLFLKADNINGWFKNVQPPKFKTNKKEENKIHFVFFLSVYFSTFLG